MRSASFEGLFAGEKKLKMYILFEKSGWRFQFLAFFGGVNWIFLSMANFSSECKEIFWQDGNQLITES